MTLDDVLTIELKEKLEGVIATHKEIASFALDFDEKKNAVLIIMYLEECDTQPQEKAVETSFSIAVDLDNHGFKNNKYFPSFAGLDNFLDVINTKNLKPITAKRIGGGPKIDIASSGFIARKYKGDLDDDL